MRRLSRRAAALTAVASSVALAAPAALAANIDVTVTGLGGTRQFSVEDLTGATLSALDLGTGQAKPFRTHVADSSFLPLSAVTDDYSVNATLSNLYLKTGASTYNYAVKIPSSDLKINFGANPLAGSGITLQDLPKLTVSGVIGSCATLPTALQSALGLATSTGLVGGILKTIGQPLDSSNTALNTLCTTLSSGTASLSATVDGLVQNLMPTLNSITDLPSVLGGATGGTFTNPSFAAGTVGAGDTAGATGAPAATAVSLMTGTANLSSGLVTALTAVLNNALAGLPLVPNGTPGAASSLTAALAGLASSTSNAVANQLAAALSTLTDAQKTTVLDGLGLSLAPLAPVLADIKGITGSYYAFPVLSATPNTPVAGTYGGTMTVTFVQS